MLKGTAKVAPWHKAPWGDGHVTTGRGPGGQHRPSGYNWGSEKPPSHPASGAPPASEQSGREHLSQPRRRLPGWASGRRQAARGRSHSTSSTHLTWRCHTSPRADAELSPLLGLKTVPCSSCLGSFPLSTQNCLSVSPSPAASCRCPVPVPLWGPSRAPSAIGHPWKTAFSSGKAMSQMIHLNIKLWGPVWS